MKAILKNIAKVRIGYQLRGRLKRDPAGTHRIVQMRDIGSRSVLQKADLSTFMPKRDPARYLVSGGDVLFLARGNRNLAYTTEGLGEDVVASSHFFIVEPDLKQVRPGFLVWCLNSRRVQSFLKSNSQGTTMMLVPRSVFENVEIEVPPFDVQDHVTKLTALRNGQRDLAEQLEEKRDALIEGACLTAIKIASTKESMNV